MGCTVAVHRAEYNAAVARASAQAGQLQQIASTEERIRILTDSIAAKTERIAEYGNPEQKYEEARTAWTTIYRGRVELVDSNCRELNDLSGGEIRASLRRGADASALRDRLEQLISGTRIRTKKLDDLCELIANAADPVGEWNKVLQELETLAVIAPPDEGSLELPATPLLIQAGFVVSDLERMTRKLTVQDWIEISLVELEDVVDFEYKQRESDYIRFSDASSGQQATALLRVLLS